MEPGTYVLEKTLEDRIKQAIDLNTVLTDEFELDGIHYCFKGWPQVFSDGSYGVFWTKSQSEHSHGGQQGFVGYRDEYDFADHEDCGMCHPVNEQSYWNSMQRVRDRERLKFSVTDWTPEDEFWNVNL